VGVLTVFAFSSENWNRPPDEVSGLMELMVLALGREVPRLCEDGVRLHGWFDIREAAGLTSKATTIGPCSDRPELRDL
jgi:undecaprenyl diphosphate synthase